MVSPLLPVYVREELHGPELAVALSFSGGGLRAAAFSFGVLKALEASSRPGNDLLADLKLDVAHLARYSPRKGTVAERRGWMAFGPNSRQEGNQQGQGSG